MDSSRRHLLGAMGTGLAALALLPTSTLAAAGEAAVREKARCLPLLGFGKAMRSDTGKPAYFASAADLDAGTVRPMELPFFGHGCSFHPRRPHEAVVFEKQGHGCCMIDWKKGEILRTVPHKPGRLYYGHGAWAAGGKELFVAETEIESGEGLVVVVDERGRDLGAFPTFGSNPHDLLLIDDGKVLVVGNSGDTIKGDAPSVAFIDVRTHKLLDRVRPTDPLVNVGHIAVGPAGDLVVISAPRKGLPENGHGGVALRRRKGERIVQMPTAPKVPGMIGEALSIAIEPRRRLVAVTHPLGDLVTVWSLDDQALRKTIELDKPRGLIAAGDGKRLVISHGQGRLALLSWETLEVVGRPKLPMTPFSGSHLYQLPRA